MSPPLPTKALPPHGLDPPVAIPHCKYVIIAAYPKPGTYIPPPLLGFPSQNSPTGGSSTAGNRAHAREDSLQFSSLVRNGGGGRPGRPGKFRRTLSPPSTSRTFRGASSFPTIRGQAVWGLPLLQHPDRGPAQAGAPRAFPRPRAASWASLPDAQRPWTRRGRASQQQGPPNPSLRQGPAA